MGEAKKKLERREAHARKIVAAFEEFIDAKIRNYQYSTMKHFVDTTREELIDILVTPPPKE